MNTVKQVEEKLRRQMSIYQKTFETQLKQKVVELQINQKRMVGIVGIKQICRNIMEDEELIGLKNRDLGEYDRQIENKFDQQWQIEVDKIKREMQNDEMINQQFQCIYDQFKCKVEMIAKLTFDIDDYNRDSDSVMSQISSMLSRNRKSDTDEQIIDMRYQLNPKHLQIVQSQLENRIYKSQLHGSHNYIQEIKQFFKKVYVYKCMNPQESFERYQEKIKKDLTEDIYQVFKVYQKLQKVKHDNEQQQKNYEDAKNKLGAKLNQLRRSGFYLGVVMQRRLTRKENTYYFGNQNETCKNIDEIMSELYGLHFLRESNISIGMEYNSVGYWSAEIEKYSSTYTVRQEEKHDLIGENEYEFNESMSKQLNEQLMTKNIMYLCRFKRVEYVLEKGAINKQANKFGGKDELVGCLEIFKDLNNNGIPPYMKKESLSSLMDGLVDWSKLTHNLKKGIEEMLEVDNDMMGNRDMIFHQIPIQRYDRIYQDVIKRQVDVLNDEIISICGLSLTKQFQGLITYCALLLIIQELRQMQDKQNKEQIVRFDATKQYYLQVFKNQIYQKTHEISQNSGQLIVQNAFQDIMNIKRKSTLLSVIEQLKNSEYTKQYDFHFNYERIFDKVLKQEYSVQETIRYFTDSRKFYIDEVMVKKTELNELMEQRQEEVKKVGLEVLKEGKEQIQTFIQTLESSQYSDIDVLEFLKLSIDGKQVEVKEFQDHESRNMAVDLSKFYFDVMLTNFEDIRLYEREFQIDNKEYKIGVQQGFKDIYQLYVLKVKNLDSSQQTQKLLQKCNDNFQSNTSEYQIWGLKGMLEGMLKKIQELENDIDKYTNYQNNELLAIKEELVLKMKGCNYSCRFCNCQCQLGYHDESTKHSCDKYGHNLRVFAKGVFQVDNQKYYPSLQICNTIPNENQIKINKQFYSWSELQKLQQKNFEIQYESLKYKSRQDNLIKDVWKYIGKEYCRQIDIDYIDNFDLEYNQTIMWYESMHVILCLDSSGSMRGSIFSLEKLPWMKIKNAAITLYKKVQNSHKDLKNCRISIITFNNEAETVYSEDIHQNEIDMDKILQFKGGGTSFSSAFDEIHTLLQVHFKSYMNHRVVFYTDGLGNSARKEVDEICDYIEKEQQNLRVDLCCLTKNNEKLQEVKTALNSVDDDHKICNLYPDINEDNFEKKIIELFKFQE